MKPSVPCVWAPHQSSGTGGTTAAATSFFTSRLPTCGPLPWVTTTSWPAATSRAISPAAAVTAAIWAPGVAEPSGPVIALPPRATSTRTRRTYPTAPRRRAVQFCRPAATDAGNFAVSAPEPAPHARSPASVPGCGGP